MTRESTSSAKGFTPAGKSRKELSLRRFTDPSQAAPRSSALSRAEERALLSAVRRGDTAARARLVESLAGSVFRFGRTFCRDADDADDVFQEVLLKLLESLPRFRGESALSTWAFTVARRTCALRRRRAARYASLEGRAGRPARTIADPLASPSRDAERDELRATLERGLASLPAAQREVVLLRDVEGRSASEVAAALGIGERAVKSRLHRARRALRAQLAPLRVAPTREGCPDIELLVSRAMEGELDAATCRRLEKHVSECASCRRTCHAVRSVLGKCRAWGEEKLPKPLAGAARATLAAVEPGVTVSPGASRSVGRGRST